MPRTLRFIARRCGASIVFVVALLGVSQVRADDVASRMGAAAAAFLDGLDEGQRAAVAHPFDEGRKDWHFVPRPRDGLALSAMSGEQRQRAFALIREGLSEQGVETVEAIRSLESVLQAIEGPDRRFPRDPDDYHLHLFATPGSAEWGWRFEGHHVSINATVVEGAGVSMSPRFLGANPAEVPSGAMKGLRVLKSEEDLGFALAKSLSEQQAERAVFETKAPRDIFTGAQREASPLPVAGIAYGDLDTQQKGLLRELLQCYLDKVEGEVLAGALAKIEKDGWESLRFAWAGPIDLSRGNYYFIQGPSFLVEYDNTQSGNNHIHSVWRDFDGDFGEDLIRAHRAAHSHR